MKIEPCTYVEEGEFVEQLIDLPFIEEFSSMSIVNKSQL